MIQRDAKGFIFDNSGGDQMDAACRVSIMALSGSKQDEQLLPAFENGNGVMVRSPQEAPANNPNNCTRDQLLPYVAALAASGRTEIVRRLFEAHKQRNWRCQNTEYDVPGSGKQFPDGPDFLDWGHRWFFSVCAEDKSQHWRWLLGAPWLLLTLLWNSKWGDEQNQIASVCYALGPKWLALYKRLTPDYDVRITAYWSGWRQQSEISYLFVTKLKSTN